ncbi:hypothetical protein TRFO_28638 [Tritrichomonas foetus]|uniref:Uncharacterized protein n=1 Tax=Tritrichomonas foetus TaxID=1144522 RepID=A0A1J4JXU4_9EUKA|nr:hypothetical protein TRFO_28638 [Tritrichomonas foetus]|eukprot:OHT03977.1 hypothetical protein TRFO_28638 [Tritrichomonas foetus]
MSKLTPLSEQEINSLVFLQSQLINVNVDNFNNTETTLANSLWCSKSELIPQLVHNIIVTSIYRPYSNDTLAKLLNSIAKAMPARNDFTSHLLTTLLETILKRSFKPLRGPTMSLLMYLTLEGFFTIKEITSRIKTYKNSSFEEICFNVFVWLAPEIEKEDNDFFHDSIRVCEKMKENFETLYPTVQRFLFDLPKLRENDWQNLIQRRSATIKIFSSIFKHNDIENLMQLSFHPQFNPLQKVAQSIYETSFVVSNMPTLVEFAAFCGSIDCFEFLMEKGADPTDTDMFGKTLQEFAVCGGNLEIINELNDNEFDCSEFYHLKARFFHDVKDEVSEKILLAASYSNNIKVIHNCLEKGINVDTFDEDNKKTPLIIASCFGHLDTIKLLLAKGANINHQDKDGLSPLQHASQNGYADIVEILLSFDNIDVNSKHKFDMDSLHWACQKGHLEIVKMLLNTHKVDINGVDDENWTPVHWAVQNGHDEILQLLLSQPGIKINVHQKDEMTPLHFAATTGNLSALKMLLAVDGIEVDTVDNGGLTPLHWACQNGKANIVKHLISVDKRSSVNKLDEEGWAPIHWAAQNDHSDVILELSKSDVIDLNIKNGQNMTPLLIASLNSATEALKVLLTLEKVDLEAKDETGKTALHLASRNGDLPILSILLADERINKNSKQNNGMTPLHLAVANNHVEAVELLVNAKGVDINVEDDDKTTPLQAATIMNYTEIEQLLKK